MNIQDMMKQAQQMQERLQRELAETEIEATAGGGMVTVVMNGVKQLRTVTIDPEVVSRPMTSRCCRTSSWRRSTTRSARWMRKSLGRWVG